MKDFCSIPASTVKVGLERSLVDGSEMRKAIERSNLLCIFCISHGVELQHSLGRTRQVVLLATEYAVGIAIVLKAWK